jgi:hypothetical protein
MKLLKLSHPRRFTALKVVAVIASLSLVTACGPFGKRAPTPTATLPPVPTATPIPTATPAPTETNTPLPPTATPTVIAAVIPTSIPTDTPPPPPPPPPPTPTETPTLTPLPPMEVDEARVIYHDAEVIYNDVAKYKSEIQPWLDLLVRMGDNWYGPERQVDDITAAPLPEGYRWETEGSFSSMPTGEAWWTAPGIQGRAILIGPDGGVLYTLELRLEFY